MADVFYSESLTGINPRGYESGQTASVRSRTLVLHETPAELQGTPLTAAICPRGGARDCLMATSSV